jgi:hypothetical protein
MRRYTEEEARQRLIDKTVEVLYPVFIPIEQQSVQIQLENAKVILECATAAVDQFLSKRES